MTPFGKKKKRLKPPRAGIGKTRKLEKGGPIKKTELALCPKEGVSP